MRERSIWVRNWYSNSRIGQRLFALSAVLLASLNWQNLNESPEDVSVLILDPSLMPYLIGFSFPKNKIWREDGVGWKRLTLYLSLFNSLPIITSTFYFLLNYSLISFVPTLVTRLSSRNRRVDLKRLSNKNEKEESDLMHSLPEENSTRWHSVAALLVRQTLTVREPPNWDSFVWQSNRR